MTRRGPSAVVSLLARLRNVRVSDLRGRRRFGGGLVPELADRAVLVDFVFFVTDGLGDRNAGQQHRQDEDPGAPAAAASHEPSMYGTAVDHQPLNVAETVRPGKGAGGMSRGVESA